MFNRNRQQKRKRPYSVKKTGIKDENIDRQIIAIHKGIVLKLLRQPELIEQVKDKLERKRDTGEFNYGQYITWTSILELYHQPEQFLQAMTEDSQKMRKYRRKTPFTGILTEQERIQAIEQEAFAKIDSIQVLL